ncbi:MAG: N-6 DNA methylase [Verrucomicrobiaceae bacterium]|nr:N-6 DNA methylase [Verrucomicrobiaceae bacterium]
MLPAAKNIELSAQHLLKQTLKAAASATNEASLRHELEKALETCCAQLSVAWTPFRLDLALTGTESKQARYADVAHGAVVIEYERPNSLAKGRRQLLHAQQQAEDYARLLAVQEGRMAGDYALVVWDGSHIAFGRLDNGSSKWEPLTQFGIAGAKRLLGALASDGIPLVHPLLLAHLAGPESDLGASLIPAMFNAVRKAAEARQTTKTKLLFVEWRRLFGQAVGIQTDSLKKLLERQSQMHGADYGSDVAAYLFALNTFIGLVAKLTAALALPSVSESVLNASVPLHDRIRALESGVLFRDAGVENLLNGDFFAWYADDAGWKKFEKGIQSLLAVLANISFDISRKSPESTRDLFKGLYQSFVPRALRHALGEFYTPDWLAGHVVNQAGWQLSKSLTDPTCGTGTFILEAIRRRLSNATPRTTAAELLDGLHGMDLNPLAVLAARASLVVYLSQRLNPAKPVRLPIFLADAVHPADLSGKLYEHRLQTEKGAFGFKVPASLVKSSGFFALFNRLRELIDSDKDAAFILKTLLSDKTVKALPQVERDAFEDSIGVFVKLHAEGWNGIWCSILAERFAASSMPPADFVCGNPPWVKWSHLPPDYAAIIKERCRKIGVFSDDAWVGGIEADISTVVTYVAAEKWLRRGGTLAFLITGTVFANESSQGFRRFEIPHLKLPMEVIRVEDYDEVAPFEGVSNHSALLMFRTGNPTTYPVTYRWWKPPGEKGEVKRQFISAEQFVLEAVKFDQLACPVPGTDAGPWIKGSRAQHTVWKKLFGPSKHEYTARKGITTDANGIFFVSVGDVDASSKTCQVRNHPEIGKRDDIQPVTATIEMDHVFPLLRGRGVSAFKAVPDEAFSVLVPQRGMHGDPELPATHPKTHRFLIRFRSILESRSSYKRFQKKQAWWSLWSTGAYTFAPFKVAWREMPGGRFAAALVSPQQDKGWGTRVVVPDHKLYFVPCTTQDEGAYLTAVLNAPVVSEAISAYAAQLSLGVSVVEYLALPPFDAFNEVHQKISRLGLKLTKQPELPSPEQWAELDDLARSAFGL